MPRWEQDTQSHKKLIEELVDVLSHRAPTSTLTTAHLELLVDSLASAILLVDDLMGASAQTLKALMLRTGLKEIVLTQADRQRVQRYGLVQYATDTYDMVLEVTVDEP